MTVSDLKVEMEAISKSETERKNDDQANDGSIPTIKVLDEHARQLIAKSGFPSTSGDGWQTIPNFPKFGSIISTAIIPVELYSQQTLEYMGFSIHRAPGLVTGFQRKRDLFSRLTDKLRKANDFDRESLDLPAENYTSCVTCQFLDYVREVVEKVAKFCPSRNPHWQLAFEHMGLSDEMIHHVLAPGFKYAGWGGEGIWPTMLERFELLNGLSRSIHEKLGGPPVVWVPLYVKRYPMDDSGVAIRAGEPENEGFEEDDVKEDQSEEAIEGVVEDEFERLSYEYGLNLEIARRLLEKCRLRQ